jgi:hypothetical protein
MSKQEILRNTETWANQMAGQMLSGGMLESFLALPLDGKLAGIGFFAAVTKNYEIANRVVTLRKIIQ